MSEAPRLARPLELQGRLLFEARVSGHTSLLATAERLHLSGPFGQLTIPYERIRSVTRDGGGAILLDVAGAKVWLDVRDFADKASLYRLLEQRAGANRQQAGDHQR